LYGHFIEWPNISAARSVIYTHSEEQQLAEKVVDRLPIGSIVPLGADESPTASRESQATRFLEKYPQLEGKAVVLFLGRLHPKKGLDLLIPGFAAVVRAEPSARLLLVGPGDATYLQSLRRLRAGSVTIQGDNILLGTPFIFNKANIDQFDF
jgi:glycosyltransferase involved in cell wall biosynthesis